MFLTPVISSLKSNFPEAKITYIHTPWVRSLINHIKEVDDSIEFDIYSQKNFFSRFFSALKMIFTLRKRNFDLVFLGHRSSLFGIILLLAGIPIRLGFKETKFINYFAEFDKNLNEPQRYLKILRENNFKVSSENIHLTKSGCENEIRKEIKIGKDDFVLGIFPFGGVNPGTSMDIKRWGLNNYANLISVIEKNHPEIKIILFEGIKENEKWQAENVKGNYLIEKIDLEKISVCDLFISGDTGPLHIAAAFGVSTLSIFGPSDPRLVAPVENEETNALHSYIWMQPECSPCYTPETVMDKNNSKYWIGDSFICNVGDLRCLRAIGVEYVYNKFVGIYNEIKISL